MKLKDIWKDKVDGVDDVLAKDINDMAHAVIKNEENIEQARKHLDELTGDVSEALDAIISMQNELIGGDE